MEKNEICTNQTNEASCNSLRFKGVQKCKYEKKWLSMIRGGSCIMDKDIIERLLSHLHPFIAFDWKNLKAMYLPVEGYLLPNPDELTKQDLVNILHDLTFHIKSVFKQTDLVSVLEDKHQTDLINLDEQMLLYYVYLFSFITYVAQFLSGADFGSVLRLENISHLQELVNNPPSKENLVIFVDFLFSLILRRKERKSEWNKRALAGILLSLILVGFLPALSILSSLIGKNISDVNLVGIHSNFPMLTTGGKLHVNQYLTDDARQDFRKFQTGTIAEDALLKAIRDNDLDQVKVALDRTYYPYFFPYMKQAIQQRRLEIIYMLMQYPQYNQLGYKDYTDLLIEVLKTSNRYQLNLAEEDLIRFFLANGASKVKADYKEYFPGIGKEFDRIFNKESINEMSARYARQKEKYKNIVLKATDYVVDSGETGKNITGRAKISMRDLAE